MRGWWATIRVLARWHLVPRGGTVTDTTVTGTELDDIRPPGGGTDTSRCRRQTKRQHSMMTAHTRRNLIHKAVPDNDARNVPSSGYLMHHARFLRGVGLV